MKFRVSYYLPQEVEDGRAPRHQQDVDANNCEQAGLMIITANVGAVVFKCYPPPSKAISDKPNFIYLTAEDRVRWYKKHYNTKKKEVIRPCKNHPACQNTVSKRSDLCEACKIPATPKEKGVCDCGEKVTKGRFCDACLQLKEKEKLWKQTQKQLSAVGKKIELA